MKNYYCLITSDTEKKCAADIINSRLKEKKFPLYKKTPFLNEIKKNDYITTFQSRFGPQEWLTPYTDQTLKKLPKKNIKSGT